jgi:hypothetical protein
LKKGKIVKLNPIIAKAIADAEKGARWQYCMDYMRELVAVLVKAGADPAKIYAMIKTGWALTDQNAKLLTKAELREWADACSEYDHLAAREKN